MARLTFLALASAVALAVLSGSQVAQAENSTSSLDLPNILPDHAPGELDDDGNPMVFFMGSGDIDEDDVNDPALARRRHHKKRKNTSNKHAMSEGPVGNKGMWTSSATITWYASHDLKNPQCGDGSWQPENSNHIGAVVKGWSDGPQCGEFVQLCNKEANDHCVPVRVVDKCAGCKENHVDLTKSAFRKLSPSGTLKEGRIHGLQMYHYSNKPSPWDVSLFGPYKLKN